MITNSKFLMFILIIIFNIKMDFPKNYSKTYKTYRGIIESNNCYYYILNEIFDLGESKSFTASKFQIVDGERIFDNKKYLIRLISIEWIRDKIFNKFKFSKISEENFFTNILKNCDFIKEKLEFNHIQKLYDCIIEERGIFIVLEYLDISLKEYVAQLKEPIKNSKTFPFEVKIRKILTQIISSLIYIHNEKNLFLGALLNPHEIMIQQVESVMFSDEEKNNKEVSVKLPNPFMSDIFTIFYISESKVNNYFPSYLAPEIINDFELSQNKKFTFDFGNLFSKISHNSDMWSLGFLVYELLFDEEPFNFENSKSAINSLNENFTYYIYPHKITKAVLAIIIKCFQINGSSRMDSILLNGIKISIERENDSLESIEMILKKNIESKEKENNMGIVEFDIVSDNGYDFRDL